MKKIFSIIVLTLVICALLSSCIFDDLFDFGHTHEFGDWTTITEPSCFAMGEKMRSCSCGYSETSTIPTVEHTTISNTEKDENCNILFVISCTLCDHKQIADTGVIEHGFGAWSPVTDGEHTTECGTDMTFSRSCTDCGKHETKTEYSSDHLFGEWSKMANETGNCDCESEIVYVRVCSVCHTAGSRTEPVPGHKFTSWKAVNEPTERCEGLLKQTCKNCSCHVNEITLPTLSDETLASGVYSYTEIAKTCISNGAKNYTYKNGDIDMTFTTVIPSYSHECVNGVCKICGKTIVAGLYDKDDNLLATWDELVNKYNLNFEADYSAYEEYYNRTPGSKMHSISELSTGTRLVIGNIKRIGEAVFYNCNYLTSVVISDTVEEIRPEAFDGCDGLTCLEIPANVEYFWQGPSFCRSLVEFKVADGNKKFKAIDGNLYSKDGTTLIQYALGKKDSSFVIPDGVAKMETFAFSFADALKNITIPDSMTIIDSFSIASSNVETLIIPNSIVEIDDYVFHTMNTIKHVYFTGTKEEWSNIKIGSNNGDLNKAEIHYNYILE